MNKAVFSLDDEFYDPKRRNFGQYPGGNVHTRWKQAQARNDRYPDGDRQIDRTGIGQLKTRCGAEQHEHNDTVEHAAPHIKVAA